MKRLATVGGVTGYTLTETSFSYSFDGIGNRLGGTAYSQSSESFASNALNQYAAINRSANTLTVQGVSAPGTTVRINGLIAYWQGAHFAGSVQLAWGDSPQWLATTVTEEKPGQPTVELTGKLFFPGRVETPSYDLDGNLTGDA